MEDDEEREGNEENEENEETEKKQILCALEQAEGNRSLAAQLLGIGRTTLYNKLKTYGIE